MGLAGAARSARAVGVGQGASAGRVAGAFEPVARLAGRVRGPAAPDRGPGRGGAPAGRADPRWRFDRMATVCHPGSGGCTASFGPVAAHYQVGIDLPGRSRLAQGRGGEGRAHHRATLVAHPGRRGHPGPGAGRPGPDLRARRRRKRIRDGMRTTVGELADAEPLRPVPAPFPAVLEVERTVSNQALVSFRGNRTRCRPATPGGGGGAPPARHHHPGRGHRHGGGAGPASPRPRRRRRGGPPDEHVAALEKVVLANFTDRPPCRRKTPPPTERGGAGRGRPDPPQQPAPAGRAGGHRLRPLRRPPFGRCGARPNMTGRPDEPMTGEAATYQRLRAHQRLVCGWPRRPRRCPRCSMTPATRTCPRWPRWSGCWPSRSTPPRPAGHAGGCGSPVCPPPTLDEFDFTAQPGVDEKLIRELASLRFLDDAGNVLFVGPPGTGKTMLAIGLARAAATAGHRVYFTTADDLAQTLPKRRAGRPLGHLHAVLLRPTAAGHRRVRLRPKKS